MKIQSIERVARVRHIQDVPKEPLPQIAIAGRSNVGKSSLLNLMLGKKLAPISQTPGKTKTLDFFRINNHFFLVDLPGFGFAHKSKSLRQEWKHLIEAYLENESRLQGLLHLIDVRRSFMPPDYQLSEWLETLELPELIIATKCDKFPKGRLHRELRVLQNQVGDRPVIPTSVKDRLSGQAVWKGINAFLPE